MIIRRKNSIARRCLVFLFGSVLTGASAQPTVDLGLFPGPRLGELEVRIKANGNFDQLISGLLFTVRWPASAGGELNEGALEQLCSRIPVVPNGDGVQEANGSLYQTFFVQGFQSLGSTCPLANGAELAIMTIPAEGLVACASFQLVNDGYTGPNNKNFYASLNGLDRTGAFYAPGGVEVCPCNTQLELALTTNDQPAQTTWELLRLDNGQVAASGGPYPGQAGQTLVEAICVPQGCYRLRVLDSGGNGMEPGGYVLRLPNGDRIIDADGTFGSESALDNAKGFCVPLGPTHLKPTWCDRDDVVLGSTLNAQSVASATSYQFWLFDPHGTFDRVVQRSNPALPVPLSVSAQVPFGLGLNVRVRARIGGVWTEYGKTCRLRFVESQNLQGPTQVQALEADLVRSAVTVYPNPARPGPINLEVTGSVEGEWLDMHLSDALGRIIWQGHGQVMGGGLVGLTLPANRAGPLWVALYAPGRAWSARAPILLLP
jgi:hypothetical protein